MVRFSETGSQGSMIRGRPKIEAVIGLSIDQMADVKMVRGSL